MAANLVKIKGCFRALGSFLKNVLSLKFPLWLYIVVFLAAVLFAWLVSCSALKNLDDQKRIDSAVVGFTEYRGHSYLVFYAAGNFSVIHDPECMCYSLNN